MLRHPNIVVAHETEEYEGNPYIVYEFLDGESLDSIIRAGAPLTILQKLDIMLQVLEALQYVHARGFVHRDVKPGNIFLLRNG